MKKLLAIFTAVAMFAGMLTSCTSDSNNDTITEQPLSNYFAYVTDLTTGTDAYYSQVSYTLRINYTKFTADVLIFNFRTPDGSSYPTISLSDIPWRMKDTQLIVSGANLTPSGVSAPLAFSNFTLTLSPRVVENVYSPGVCITYTVNGRFAVTSASPVQVVYGKTTTTDADGKAFESEKTYYRLNFNVDTRRVGIRMFSTNFIAQMPAMDIDLMNVPFIINGSSAQWSVAAITPEIGGVPYGAFPITDLKGDFNFAEGLDMEFDCKPRNMGLFHVEADCDTETVPEI